MAWLDSGTAGGLELTGLRWRSQAWAKVDGLQQEQDSRWGWGYHGSWQQRQRQQWGSTHGQSGRRQGTDGGQGQGQV